MTTFFNRPGDVVSQTMVVVHCVDRVTAEHFSFMVPYVEFIKANAPSIADFAMDTVDLHNTGPAPIFGDFGALHFQSAELS